MRHGILWMGIRNLMGWLVIFGCIGTARAEVYWLDSRDDPAQPHYRTDSEACLLGEMKRRLDGYQPNGGSAYRYRNASVSEVNGYSICRGTIERLRFGRWWPAELVVADVYQRGSRPACNLPGLADPETGQCGIPKCNSDCPVAGGNGSNPIDSATGNKRQVETDYVGSGSFPLQLVRTYNSHRTIDNQRLPLGVGWTHSYQARLVPLLNGNEVTRIRAYRPNGAVQTFVRDGGAWVGDGDVPERLMVTLDGTTLVTARYIRSDDTVENYDAAGNLVTLTRRGGDTQTLSYVTVEGASAQVGRVTGPDGRSLIFTYSGGRLASVTDPSGGVIRYGHAEGNLVSVTHSMGTAEESTRWYHYGEPGQTGGVSQPHALTGITDENGQRYASWSYDGQRRGVLSVHGAANGWVDRTALKFNDDGTSSITDSLGKTRVYRFQVQHGVARLSALDVFCPSCANTARTKTYDANGMPDTSVDFSGVVTDTDFDARRLEVKRVDAANDVSGRTRTTRTDWHPELRMPVERLVRNSDGALVSRINWTYNNRGQVLASSAVEPTTGAIRTVTTTYCEAGDVSSGACPRTGLIATVDGARTDLNDQLRYAYYPGDAATCASAPATCPYRKGDLWKVTNAKGQVTETLKYDGAGRVLSVKDPNGVITDFEYHPRGWLTASKVRGANDAVETDDAITRIEYWPTGLVKRMTQPDGAFTQYTYDPAHRLTDISDNAGNTIHYVLDNAGNRIAEETKDVGGMLKRSLSRVYNQLGQLATQADAQAHPTDFTYDANGNLNTVTDALGRVTDNDHDPLNRLARTLQNVGGIAAETKFQYDALDQLTKVTDPKGLDTTYTYNGLGDLTKLQSPDTGTTTYTYDSAGNRASQTDARGVTTTYAHDVLNRLTAVSYPDTSLNVGYTYDTTPTVCEAGETFSIGRLSGMDDASGSTRYCYNRFGHLVRKVQTTNGVSFVVRYAYTLAGNLQAMVYPDGTTVDYGRNAQGQVTEVGVTRSGQPRQVLLSQAAYHPFGPVAGWTYGNGRTLSRTLDQDYRPLTIEDPNTGGLSLGFGYDAVGNLTTLGTAQGVANPAIRFGYDALGRLTRTEDGPTQAAIDVYAYDATGNRTAHTTAAGTAAYSYPTTSHRLSAVAGVSRSYDAVGNTTAIGGTRGFAYNDANRMSLVQQAGVTTRQYAYNGRGEQVRRYLGSTNTYTVYDEAGHWLGDYDDTGAPVQQALWMDDLPVGLLANGHQLHYVQPDHLGSPRVVIEAARNVPVWTWDLKGEAFGSTAPQQDPDGDGISFVLDMRFPGQRYDTASALNQNYFRDYDVNTGRYAESDPLGLDGGISTYSYVYGNPVGDIDPFGLISGGKGERGRTRSPGGTNNPGKHWRDNPDRPGWGWQKDQNGKWIPKKKPPYLLPPKAVGPLLALRIALQVACESGDISSCQSLCAIFPEACSEIDPKFPGLAACPSTSTADAGLK